MKTGCIWRIRHSVYCMLSFRECAKDKDKANLFDKQWRHSNLQRMVNVELLKFDSMATFKTTILMM